MIRNERTSSEELLADARFHSAALGANSNTTDLQSEAEQALDALENAIRETRQRQLLLVKAQALFEQADFALDEEVRKVELFVLMETGKNRKDPLYQAIFPRGMVTIVRMRGQEEARAVQKLVELLKANLPQLSEARSEKLLALAREVVSAQQTRLDAGVALDVARHAEFAVRRKLVEMLRTHEGVLMSRFPGRKDRVRRFFRALPKPTVVRELPASPTPPAAEAAG